MAYEYDRFEREDGGGSFLMGLLAGTVLGPGSECCSRRNGPMRNQVSEQAGRLRTTANDAYSQATEKVSQMVDKGREAYDRARTAVASTLARRVARRPVATRAPSGVGAGTGTGGGYGAGGYGSDRG